MATEADKLKENITKLTDKIYKLKKVTFPPAVDPLYDMVDEPDFFMTDRQVAKKIMITTSGTIPGVEGESAIPKMDEETAHLAIYGKLMYKSDGSLEDNEVKNPDCVDWIQFKKSPDSDEDVFPMKDKIQEMKIEVKNSIKGLSIKKAELSEAVKKAGIEISVGVGAFIDASTNMPKPQPALALSSVLSILSSISKLQAKVLEIIPFLGPLLNLTVLLPITMIDIVLGLINVILTVLITIIGTIESVTVKPLEPITKLIPSKQSDIDKIVNQSSKGTCNGVVKSMLTNKPIKGAKVTITSNNTEIGSTITTNNGSYTISKIDVGAVTITASAFGYNSNSVDVTVEAGKVLTTYITLPIEN